MLTKRSTQTDILRKNDIYQAIKDEIQFLNLQPGTRINEMDLSTELGVSRTPIREALIRLADEMLINIYPQRGTYVAKIDIALAREMAYMRHILETEICQDLCRRKVRISEQVERQLHLMSLALKKQDTIEYIRNDEAFHREIFNIGNHLEIWKIISSTRAHYNRILVLDLSIPDSMKASYEDHLALVQYIENGEIDQMMKLLVSHHDHQNFDHEAQLKAMYPEYLI